MRLSSRRLSEKDNRDEVAGVFIQVKVWLKNILSQSEGGVTGRERFLVEEQAVESKDPKWRPLDRQRCKGETAQCRSEEGEQWDLVLVILPAYTTNEDGTECSETSAYKIQKPGIIQKKECNYQIIWLLLYVDTIKLVLSNTPLLFYLLYYSGDMFRLSI